jgi:hypothetical protein
MNPSLFAAIAIVARREAIALLRQRITWWATALVAAALLASRDIAATATGAVALSAAVTVLAATFAVAGRLADDRRTGALMHDLLALESPTALAAGGVVGSLAGVAPALLLAAAAAGRATFAAGGALAATAIPLVLLLLAAAWVAFGAFLGALLPGKGNLVVLVPLVLFAGLRPEALSLTGWPESLGNALRGAWGALPLIAHAAAVRDYVLGMIALPVGAVAALVAGPVAWTAAASTVLAWRRRHGRWTP